MDKMIATMQQQLKAAGIIAIIRGDFDPGFVRELAAVLVENHVTALEMTLNSAGVLALIPQLRDLVGSGAVVGAGTVRRVEQVEAAFDAGAQFMVAPNLDIASCKKAQQLGIAHLPGVFTPTEMQNAANVGCSMVKLFPATIVGPAYVKAVRAPLDDIDIVAVGGVDAQNVDQYIQAGAAAVGVGSTLVKKDRSLEEVGWQAAALHEALAAARS